MDLYQYREYPALVTLLQILQDRNAPKRITYVLKVVHELDYLLKQIKKLDPHIQRSLFRAVRRDFKYKATFSKLEPEELSRLQNYIHARCKLMIKQTKNPTSPR